MFPRWTLIWGHPIGGGNLSTLWRLTLLVCGILPESERSVGRSFAATHHFSKHSFLIFAGTIAVLGHWWVSFLYPPYARSDPNYLYLYLIVQSNVDRMFIKVIILDVLVFDVIWLCDDLFLSFKIYNSLIFKVI